MVIHAILGLPAQTRKEIKIFKGILDNVDNGNKIKIFEWGSGFSTIYYANYVRKKKVNFEWHTIDNNKAWHEKVKELVRKKNLEPYVWLYLKEFEPFWEKPGWGSVPPPCGLFAPSSGNERNYIDFPRRLGETFDVVIVDARFRRHCAQTAKDVINPDGLVILHDAQKPHYHEGLDAFPYGRFLDSGMWYPLQDAPNQMWIGSLKNHGVFERLKAF